ncbi:MAG: DNA polymerase III subunit gamma/tau [Thermoleophilia bacterium]|jgi:DNA polymerase-3 subunit gamma/tau
MSVSLYRKYRPARFEDIVGQEHVARTLRNAIIHDRVSHAYLFTGPRGTGKTSTAKILAMALNCEAGKGAATATPDGTCPRCEAIKRGSALDVVEMDAASNRTVEEVTEMLLDKVNFAPLEGRMKVYILDEVHMLSGHAFNALLKTLEEPPAHAVFVLATTEPHKVPATILSRCQRFDFRRPSVDEVVAVLASIAHHEGIKVAEASLTVMARAGGGSFRDAIGVLDQLATYSDGDISLQQTLDILGIVQHDLLFEIVNLVYEHDTRGALLFVDRLNQAGTDYNQFMKDLLGHLRDLYVVKHTVDMPAGMTISEEQLETMRSQAGRASTHRIVAFIELLGEGLRAVRQGSDPRLELELVLIKMTAFGQGTPAPPNMAMQPAPPVIAEAPEAPVEPAHAVPKRATETPTDTPPTTQPPAPQAAADHPATAMDRPAREANIPLDVEHLRRAWTVLLDAVNKRQAGLAAVLAEGRLDSLEGDELVIKFPAGFGFQADQVARGKNPQVIAAALRELTGRDLRVVTRLATEPAATATPDEDARILDRDELIRMLKDEFDAQIIDDGPPC